MKTLGYIVMGGPPEARFPGVLQNNGTLVLEKRATLFMSEDAIREAIKQTVGSGPEYEANWSEPEILPVVDSDE